MKWRCTHQSAQPLYIESMENLPEIVVGVSGASGSIYADRLMHYIAGNVIIHLIITPTALEIARHEGVDLERYTKGTSGSKKIILHRLDDISAVTASGSFRHNGMVIIPCSMKTLSAVATGASSNLLTRSADVSLKERRKLILVLRENPLSRIHMTNMITAHDAGATIMMANPPFYHKPDSITELVDAVVARILDSLEIEHSITCRWSGY